MNTSADKVNAMMGKSKSKMNSQQMQRQQSMRVTCSLWQISMS